MRKVLLLGSTIFVSVVVVVFSWRAAVLSGQDNRAPASNKTNRASKSAIQASKGQKDDDPPTDCYCPLYIFCENVGYTTYYAEECDGDDWTLVDGEDGLTTPIYCPYAEPPACPSGDVCIHIARKKTLRGNKRGHFSHVAKSANADSVINKGSKTYLTMLEPDEHLPLRNGAVEVKRQIVKWGPTSKRRYAQVFLIWVDPARAKFPTTPTASGKQEELQPRLFGIGREIEKPAFDVPDTASDAQVPSAHGMYQLETKDGFKYQILTKKP